MFYTATPRTPQVVLLSEIEPYRIYDVAASLTHTKQTSEIPPCHLTFVSQGAGGALSLVLIGSPACQKDPLLPRVYVSVPVSSRRRKRKRQDKGVLASDPQHPVSGAVSEERLVRTSSRILLHVSLGAGSERVAQERLGGLWWR